MDFERYLFALRIAISVVIVAGISLWMGWERPMWAMFAVIYPAIGGAAESLHKGIMRLGATFLGGGLSLLITGLFSDERWLFGGAVMLWVMFCTYMMQNTRHWYLWFHSTILVVLMPIYSAEQPAIAFEVVMLRLQETLLGVAVYTLVANVLLPDGARRDLARNLSGQVGATRTALVNLIDAFRQDAPEQDDDRRIKELRIEAAALHTDFRVRIDAGIVESFDMVENRDAWRRIIDELDAIIRALDRLRLSLGDIRRGKIGAQRPEFFVIADEVGRRLAETGAVLDGTTIVDLPRAVDVRPAVQAGASDDIFDTGAIEACLDVLHDLERQSADLLVAAAEARGLIGRSLSRKAATPPLPATIIPDPDGILSVLRVWMIFSLAFMLFIYIPALPAGTSVILLSTIIGSFVCTKPTLPTRPVEIVGTLVIVLAGFIHVVIMPKLSSFWELGTLLFLYMFVFAALLADAKVTPMRFIALGFAAMIFQITPDQEYSFLYVANMFLAFQVPFMLLWVTQSVPVSFRPEDMFQRLVRRYMASFGQLVAGMQYDSRRRHQGWWARQLRNWHLCNLMRIPGKLNGWIGAMPEAAMSEADRASSLALSQALDDLSARMVEFSRMHDARYNSDAVTRLRPAVRAWREALEDLSRDFRRAPDALPSAEQLTDRLAVQLDRVRADTETMQIQGIVDSAPGAGKTLWRELAAYRGISEALISATRHASMLDWGRLREARF